MPTKASIAARRYAEAYFALAVEKGDVDQWRTELSRAIDTISNSEVRTALGNPRLPLSDRVQLAESLLDGSSKEVRNLVRLLIERSRVAIAPELLAEYDALADAHNGIVHVELTTATPLSEAQLEAAKRTLSKAASGTPRIEVRHDPGIIGGVIVRIGDRVIDGSLRTQLEQLHQALI